MKKYNENFQDREDVAREFNVGTGSRYGTNPFVIDPDFPTDEQILYASYDTPNYEGYAFVLFEKDGQLYEVSGSHCSCYGLEGQWYPEETSWKAIAMRGKTYATPDEIVEEAKRRAETE